MNDIVNKFLLAVDKFMPEIHLKQPGFTYSASGPFTKNKERIQKFDKACFQHDMAYRDFKNLAKRTASYKILKDNAFNIAKTSKYDGYQRGLVSMVCTFFDEKSKGSGVVNNNNKNNNNNNNNNNKILSVLAVVSF